MTKPVDTAILKADLYAACERASNALMATYKKIELMKKYNEVGLAIGDRSLGARFEYYQHLLLSEMLFIGQLKSTLKRGDANYSTKDLQRLEDLIDDIDEPARQAKDELPAFFSGLHEPLQFNGALRKLVISHWKVVWAAEKMAERISHVQILREALTSTLAHFDDLFEIFCCYSREDQAELQLIIDLLKNELTPWRIRLWRDKSMIPSSEWRSAINQKIRSVDLAIVLISKRLLASKFIKEEEMPQLYERRSNSEMLVMGLVLEACPWKKKYGWLERLHVLPEDGITVRSHYNTGDLKRDFLVNHFAKAIHDLMLEHMASFTIDLNKPPFLFVPEKPKGPTDAVASNGPRPFSSLLPTAASNLRVSEPQDGGTVVRVEGGAPRGRRAPASSVRRFPRAPLNPRSIRS